MSFFHKKRPFIGFARTKQRLMGLVAFYNVLDFFSTTYQVLYIGLSLLPVLFLILFIYSISSSCQSSPSLSIHHGLLLYAVLDFVNLSDGFRTDRRYGFPQEEKDHTSGE